MNWWQAVLTTFGCFSFSFLVLAGIIKLQAWSGERYQESFRRKVEEEYQRIMREGL